MSHVHTQALDLNLLRVLDAVFSEGSASGAARRLGLTQSAVSHALGRARDALGDPLLVRGGSGLVPTARGESLRAPVRQALAAIELAIAPPTLDPATWRGEITLSAPDSTAELVLPEAAAALARDLPGLDLRIVGPTADPVRALLDARVDLVLGRTGLDDAADLFSQRLFDDGFCCVLRPGHPALDAPWDLDAFCALRHVLISPGGSAGGIVDDRLAALGRTRRVAVQVAHFLTAARFVAASDAVCTLPLQVARHQARALDLAVLEPPLSIPGFSIGQHWHLRVHHHPAHRMLRQAIAAACAGL